MLDHLEETRKVDLAKRCIPDVSMWYKITLNRQKVNIAERHICKDTGSRSMQTDTLSSFALGSHWPWVFAVAFFDVTLLWGSPVMPPSGKGFLTSVRSLIPEVGLRWLKSQQSIKSRQPSPLLQINNKHKRESLLPEGMDHLENTPQRHLARLCYRTLSDGKPYARSV